MCLAASRSFQVTCKAISRCLLVYTTSFACQRPIDSHSSPLIVITKRVQLEKESEETMPLAVFFGSLMLGLPGVKAFHVEWVSVC